MIGFVRERSDVMEEMLEPYKVRLDAFEGPLDLLLHLIKRDEVDLYQISLERLTNQYLEYLEAMRELDVDLAVEFVLMASNLLYWKSRELLPREEQVEEEEGEEEDVRWNLIRQLVEYKKFKDAAVYLGEREEAQSAVFGRRVAELRGGELEVELAPTSVFALMKAFQKVWERFEEKYAVGEIRGDRFTVAEKMEELMAGFAVGESRMFSALVGGLETRGELIVLFLAILELLKVNEFAVEQEELFGDLVVRRVRMGELESSEG